MPQQSKQPNVAYGQQAPQPPIFGQQSQAPTQPAPGQGNAEALMRLLSLLQSGRGAPQGGMGGGGLANLLAGKGGGAPQ
jgi:hypothetical protein